MKLGFFFSDIFRFAFASFLNKSLVFLILPILTHNLSPSSYGILELLIGISGIASIIILMQLESCLARNWINIDSNSRKSNFFSTLLGIVLIFGILLIFLIFFLKNYLATILFNSEIYGYLIFLIFISAYFLALANLPLMILRMERKIGKFLIADVSQSFVYLSLIILLLFENDISLKNVVYCILSSSVFTFCLALFFVKRYLRFIFDINILKPSLRFSLPLVPAVGIIWISNQVDNYALLYFFDTKIVGEFSIIMKFAAIVNVAVLIFRQAWLPYSYALARQPDRGIGQFKIVLKTYFIITLFGALGLIYFSPIILSFFAPSNYILEYSLVPVILLSSIVYGSASIVNIGTIISGKTEWNSYASLVGLIFNIIFTIILIPIFGVAGAAWGTLISSFIFMLVLLIRSNKLYNMNFSVTLIFTLSAIFLFSANATIYFIYE